MKSIRGRENEAKEGEEEDDTTVRSFSLFIYPRVTWQIERRRFVATAEEPPQVNAYSNVPGRN